MKKTYELRVEGKNSDRLLETAKSDVRRIGTSEESAVDVHPQQLTEVINATVAAGATQLFAHIEPVATARVYKNVAEPWTPADEQTNAAGEDSSQ